MQISIANIIRGTLIGNTMSVLTRYISRVVNGGGIVESPQCVETALNSQGLLQQASLLVVPSGYKGGTLYSEIPTNGNGDLTWTRGGDAFRTNASGLIQRVPWNLLLNTNTFSGWSLEGGALTSGFTAPDGTSTAYKYVQTTGGLYSGSSTATSGSKTASIWLKSVSGTSITCNLQDGGSGNNTVVTVTGDWQLFTATYTTSTSRPSLYVWGISNASGIYVWHPQLVEGTTAQTYLPTTDRLNFPRLDYTYGSCPSALLEPQRTNVLTYSNDFTNAIWVKDNSGATNPVVTANYATSPDGSNNASRLQLNKTGGVYSRIKQSVTTSGVYTFTVWMKSNTGANQNVGIRLEGTGINCVVTTSWQRFQITTTVAISAESQILLYDLISGNDETADILIYGAQTELGAYPTTYIPTTSATATRIADSFSRNNIYTNGLISASGGTWFVELRGNLSVTNSSTDRGIFIADTTAGTSNALAIRRLSAGRNQIVKVISGTSTNLFTTTTDTVKIAIKWNGASADVFVNGTKVVSATAFATTIMENLGTRTSEEPYQFIQQMALYPTPLSDTDCTTITTL